MTAPLHEFRAHCPARRRLGRLALQLALLLCGGTTAVAAPPDLTAGGTVPTASNGSGTINLGPTGMRGWVYHVNENSSESRQILVTVVDAGSPAAGVLAANDVILGADGTGANPVAFNSDARMSLATAIADAEARNPGYLKFLRWRAGTTTTVQITLRTMGAYSPTAPYNCPKAAKILREGADYFLKHQTSGKYSFGTLALLAVSDPADPNNAAYLARARTEARALVPSASTMAQLKSDARDASSMITWQRGHTLIVLAEYYLATHDAAVLPAVEAYALNIAKNQSMFGTVGHIYAEKNADGSANGPMGGVYGVVNSTGLPCFYGLLLARECGLTNPELAPAIERTSRFFASYTDKGAIPYGEHEPYYQGHETNGKSGLAAVAFALQANRLNEGRFFEKMATASAGEREIGHTGSFFNYLWAPLGAACGGEAAAAAYFSRTSWHYDLARRWDGSFVYDYTGSNGTTPSNGREYNDFRMSTAALLTYALPLRNLHSTGKVQDPARLLGAADVSAALAANDYAAANRSNDELVSDLGSWSPKVRSQASDQLKTRTVSAALISQVTALANDPNGTSRVGACLALGKINNSSSAAARASTLAALLTDPDNHVRYVAAESLRQMGSARNPVVNTILAAAASTARPLVPFVEEDPLQFAHAKTAMLLFYSGSAYGPKGVLYSSLSGVDRNLLYPAIRAVAATPTGLARSTLASTYKLLSLNDTLAVADSIVDSVQFRAPADKMFTNGVRQGGIEVLQKYGFAEGVPLSMIYMTDDVRDSIKPAALDVLEAYAGSATTVVPDPGVIGFLQEMLTGSQAANAQAVLDAIAAVPNPNPGPATPLKSIQSVTADAATLLLPAQTSTVLRVNATNHTGDEVGSIYTWRKVLGPGAVTFTPNGTAASVNTTVQIANSPGDYLFEVTLSDSHGLTEVSATVPVTATATADDTPPTPDPLTWASAPAALSSTSITMTATTASDPSGVQYFFDCTTAGGHDSTWQDSPSYTDTGLTAATSYSYQVRARDKSMNANATGWSSSESATTSAPDTSAPTISTYSPADNATGVAVNGDLVLTFSESIVAGGGSITIRNLTDATESTIPITDAAQVSLNGAVLTINPAADLAGSKSYAIRIDTGAIKDLSDNPFAGIADDTTWNFTSAAAPPVSTEITIISQAEGFLGSDKTKVATAHNGTTLLAYDATGVDKLVVAVGTESGFNNNTATVTGVTFNGVALTQAVQENSRLNTSYDGGTAAIYYLDNPFQGAATFTVSATTSGGGLNGGWVSIIGLAGTLEGVGNTGASWATRTSVGNVSTDLTTSANASLVIAMVENSGTQNSAGTPAVVAPLILSNNGYWGTQWGSGASGYQSVPASGTAVTPTFVSSPGGNIHVIAAEFLPLPPRDNAAPTLVSIEDDKNGGSFTVNTLVTYTVSFSEDMDAATVAAADFGNAGDAVVTIGTVTETAPGVFSVPVTPTGAGTLQLQINTAAELKDLAGNALGTTPAIVDDTILTIDGTAPDLTSIVDDMGGRPVTVYALVTYTVTFSEDMDAATVDASGFGNAGTAVVNIGTVTETAPGVFSVPVTPTGAGTLQLQVSAGAGLKDVAGNVLDTTSAIPDDTILSVNADYAAWAGGPFQGSLSDDNPALDFDGGGLATGIEWVTGGDPTTGSDDAGQAPKFDNTSDPNGKFLFTYRRSDAANLDPNTTIAVQYTSDLTAWTAATHQGTGTGDITISEIPDGPGFAKVTVALPPSLAAGSRFLARLKVEVAAP